MPAASCSASGRPRWTTTASTSSATPRSNGSFQPVNVEEPTTEETFEILRGIKSKFEEHHGVIIEDEALHAAASLASRFISDRFLPDKAIDLMDEAGSRVRIRTSGKPLSP